MNRIKTLSVCLLLSCVAVAGSGAGLLGCADAPQEQPAPVSLQLEREVGQPLRGKYETVHTTILFETRRVHVVNEKGEEVLASEARIFDMHGDTIAAIGAGWPGTRRYEEFTQEQLTERLAVLDLMPELAEALEQHPVPADQEQDRAALSDLLSERESAEAGGAGLQPEGILSKYSSGGYYYGLMYEIRKKDAFIPGFFCDHTAVLVRNYVFDPGKAWRVTGWWASSNRGTAASDPSMRLHCSKWIPEKWFDGRFNECPGTNQTGWYGIDGVCHHSTLLQRLEFEGWSYAYAYWKACQNVGVMCKAPSCGPSIP